MYLMNHMNYSNDSKDFFIEFHLIKPMILNCLFKNKKEKSFPKSSSVESRVDICMLNSFLENI